MRAIVDNVTAYFPYRSAAARDSCFAYFDSIAADRWPIRSEQRTIATASGTTFVRISGPPDAPPLVLLHGAGASSLMWAPNIEALSAEYRTFAVDQIGEFGKSGCARAPGSFGELVGWLDELFDALQLERGVNLVGISYGGALAAQYALRSPARLAKVVLLAPAATVLRQTAGFWARLILVALSRGRSVPSFVRWMFADMTRRDPKWADAVIDELSLNMRSLRPRKVALPPLLSDAEWRGLQVPTLFLVGEHEVIYTAEKAVRRLKCVAPRVAAEIVPGAGHDLTFVQAAMVNRRILEFLR